MTAIQSRSPSGSGVARIAPIDDARIARESDDAAREPHQLGQVVRVSWDVSAGAVGLDDPHASARLVLEARLDDRAAHVSAWIELPDARRTLLRDSTVSSRVHRLNGHCHVELGSVDDAAPRPLLEAVFSAGRAIYVRTPLPTTAGLPGATYDVPAGEMGDG